jgi:hypothetical protein
LNTVGLFADTAFLRLQLGASSPTPAEIKRIHVDAFTAWSKVVPSWHLRTALPCFFEREPVASCQTDVWLNCLPKAPYEEGVEEANAAGAHHYWLKHRMVHPAEVFCGHIAYFTLRVVRNTLVVSLEHFEPLVSGLEAKAIVARWTRAAELLANGSK